MTDLRFTVPVVAHRLFGKKYIERPEEVIVVNGARRVGPELRGGDAIGVDGGPVTAAGSRPQPVADRTHGSTMDIETIRAMFDEDRSVDGSDGVTVNSLWQSTGIRFVLLGIVDEMVDSWFADLVPSDARLFKKPIETIAHGGRVWDEAIHVVFARQLEGKVGFGSRATRYRRAYILLQDLFDHSEPPERNWMRWIRTAAHEFGHVLKLPHMPRRENLMWWLNSPNPPEISNTQMRVAQEAASRYGMPSHVPGLAPDLGFEGG